MASRIHQAAFFAVPALLITSAWLFAGPLNPPSGPITSTGKTLTEVEPRIAINATNTPGDANSIFKITQPGSYYLTGNVTGVVGKHGIEIAASGVTLDLNGFDLVGVPGMGAFDGVATTDMLTTDIAIRNGSIRSWGDDGIDTATSLSTNGTITDVRVSGNVGTGIAAGGEFSLTGCTLYGNGGDGISTALAACQIINCTAYDNNGSGIVASAGSLVSHCISRVNTLDGIRVSSACIVVGNTCTFNGNSGGDGACIHVTGSDNRLEGNNCIGADRGIDVDAGGNIIIRNTCSGNTTNWDIVVGNHYGPIIDRTVVAVPPAVNGNSAAEALGSTHPNANFTY